MRLSQVVEIVEESYTVDSDKAMPVAGPSTPRLPRPSSSPQNNQDRSVSAPSRPVRRRRRLAMPPPPAVSPSTESTPQTTPAPSLTLLPRQNVSYSYSFPGSSVPPLLTAPPSGKGGISIGVIAALSFSGLVVGAVLIVTMCCCERMRRRRRGMRPGQGTQRSVLASELRTWTSRLGSAGTRSRIESQREKKDKEKKVRSSSRPRSPIIPGLLHTNSRPSSLILDISGPDGALIHSKKLSMINEGHSRQESEDSPQHVVPVLSLEDDPWALSRVSNFVDPKTPTSALPRPTLESVNMAWRSSLSPTSDSPSSGLPPTSPGTTTSSSAPLLPPALGVAGSYIAHPAAAVARSSTRAQPPALSVQTNMNRRPNTGTSQHTSSGSPQSGSTTSPQNILPDLGYGPGSVYSSRPYGQTPITPHAQNGYRPHSSGTGHTGDSTSRLLSTTTPTGRFYRPTSAGGLTSASAGERIAGASAGYYSAYDTHERPEWMPPLPAVPAGVVSPVSGGGGVGGLRTVVERNVDRVEEGVREIGEERESVRLSPIMWARPEEYRDLGR